MPSPRNVLIGSIIGFILLALLGYWYLGGFKEPAASLVEHKGYRLVGKYYSGESNSTEAQQTFRTVAQLHQSGEVEGVMAVVILHEATEEKDSVHQFVGILLPENNRNLPASADSLQLLEIPNRQAVRVQLEASSLVWPSPDKIVEQGKNFAADNNLKLAPKLTIEKYVSPNLLEVELPVATKRQIPALADSVNFIHSDTVVDAEN